MPEQEQIDLDPGIEPLALLIVGSSASRAAIAADVASVLARSYRVAARHYEFPDWDIIEERALGDLLDLAEMSSVVILVGFSLANLDRLFQIRAHQIHKGRAPAEIRSVAVLCSSGKEPVLGGLALRVQASWPFRELVLIGETAATAAELSRLLDCPVGEYSSETFSSAVAGSGVRLISSATRGQAVAVQIQPFWGGCGSTTAFENEIEELVALGYFVIRIFVEQHGARGRTLSRAIPRIIAENSVHAAAHLHSVAAPAKLAREVEADEGEAAEKFFSTIRVRNERCTLPAPVLELVQMAQTAIVNHIVNLGLALQICPRARLLLDTHDYFTRNAFERPAGERSRPGFSSRAQLARMARAESILWSVPDFCTTVSEHEQAVVSRHAARSGIVLPRPYVPRWAFGDRYEWDVFVVADQHDFNIRSVRWFLDVVRSHPVLRQARIAIAGRVGSHIRAKEYGDLPNVRFLGFVTDLDQVRRVARLSAIPDQGGTGIAVKTLTALAAGHPIVTTKAGVRGLSLDTDLVTHDKPGPFAREIVQLLEDSTALKARQQQSISAYAKLLGGRSFTRCLAVLPEPDNETVARRQRLVERALLQGREQHGSSADEHVARERHWSFRFGSSAQSILGEGWHSGEAWGRWMDGPLATLEVRLDPPPSGPLILSLRIRRSPARGGRLAISVNGTKLKERLARNKLSWRIPEDVSNGSRLLRIELHSSTTYCWADHQNSADRRVVGMGIRSLSISSASALQRIFGRMKDSVKRTDRVSRSITSQTVSLQPSATAAGEVPECPSRLRQAESHRR